jgi:mycoredoxin
MSHSAPLKMYTTTWCPDCTVAKSVLKKRGLEFEEINIEQDDAAAQYVMSVNGGKRSVPTLVMGEDAVSLSGFSRAKLDVFLQKHNLLSE